MRHILILFICAVQLQVFAAAPAGVAPVLVPGDKPDEARFGVITSDFSPRRPDALTILRNELNRQAHIEQEKAERDGVFKSTNKRFAPESLTFFIAMGAVTFNSMWIKSHGDPLAMERHILSLKDPIAHISFYSFMQTQGFYMNFHTKRAGMGMDASTRSQMMRRLSYQGMAVGSLASSIVADLGQSVKMCTNKWLKGKTDEQSLASCNHAWKQWNVREKFTQYFPLIISMWAAQAATELIEKTGQQAFGRVAAASFMNKMLSKEFLVRQAYKVTGADVVLTFAGGGWFTKSLKFVGKVTRFGLFVSVDHILSNYTYRPLNNLIKPAMFDFDAVNINKLWMEADQKDWDTSKIQNIEKFEKQIESFGKHMQEWRDHLNQDAEGDLAGWQEMTKKLLNQMDYAYKYYKGFAGSMFETLYVGNRIHNGQAQDAEALNIGRYPQRTLPFYGVKPGAYYMGNGGRMEDLYILSPNELERKQKAHVLMVGKRVQAQMPSFKSQSELQTLARIVSKLATGKNDTMASGLNDLNKAIALFEAEVSREMRSKAPNVRTGYDYMNYMKKFRELLGNPQPVVYPVASYSQAFAAYGPNQLVAEAADFGKWSVVHKFKFNKEADLMLYRMVCGNPQGHIRKIQLAGVNILSPQYIPPGLMKPDQDRAAFCSGIRTTENLYSTNIGGETLLKYIMHNTNWAAIGDFRNQGNPQIFDMWWFKNAKQPVNAQFMAFDQEYKKVYQKAYNNYFDHRSFFKWAVDGLNQSRYLPKSLGAALKFETNLYLQIMNRALLLGPVQQLTAARSTVGEVMGRVLVGTPLGTATALVNEFNQFNYVEHAKKDSETQNYSSIYKKAPREIMTLHSLMESYHTLIQNPLMNFNQYIAASKKIDGAINDILVLAKLKKVTDQVNEEIEDLSQPPAASGSEDSVKVYEDVEVQNPSYRQRMIIAAVQGLHSVESEIRRFIRMRVSLSRTLEIDTQEFMADYNNVNQQRRQGHRMNPFGAH